MFYKKPIGGKKINYKTVQLNFLKGTNTDINPNVLNLAVGAQCFNFDSGNGALANGYGFNKDTTRDMRWPAGVKFLGAWAYGDVIVLYGNDKKLYWFYTSSKDPNVYTFYNLTFNNKPNIINFVTGGRNLLILTSASDNMLVWDGTLVPQTVPLAPKIKSACSFNNRLFALVEGDRNNILYSENLDPTGWVSTGGEDAPGKMQLFNEPANLNKIVVFKNYLYVFGDFAVTKVSAVLDNFSVSTVFTSAYKIYPDSIAVCGAEIFMTTAGGIFIFDGVSAKKAELPANSLFDNINGNVQACNFNGKYFAALSDDILFALDTASGAFSITKGVNITAMLAIHTDNTDELLVCIGDGSGTAGLIDNSGTYFDAVLKKVWSSAVTDFGVSRQDKIIKRLFVRSRTPCVITVTADGKSKDFEVMSAKTGVTRLITNIKGRNFSFKITSERAENEIYGLEFYIGFLEGESV